MKKKKEESLIVTITKCLQRVFLTIIVGIIMLWVGFSFEFDVTVRKKNSDGSTLKGAGLITTAGNYYKLVKKVF